MADPIAMQPVKLSIVSHPKFLQQVRGMMKSITAALNIAPDQAYFIILAVDEACSNIIRHSYMNDPSGKIVFEIFPHRTMLEISITDYGKQCDIRQMTPRSPQDKRPGGLGLYIIHQVMDQVDYQCLDSGKNVMRMVKRFN